MKFGEKIRLLRKGKYTQEELADILNIHVNTLLRWEHGERTPNLEKLKALANALDTTVEFLTDENAEVPKNENEQTENQPPEAEENIKMVNGLFKENDPSFVRELIKSTPMFIYENGKERFFTPATSDGYNFVERMRAGNLAMAN